MRTMLFAFLSLSTALHGQFVNFESPPTHPIRVSSDGLRLFAVQTPEARLGVWSLANPDAPVLLSEIAVGLEPVSVTEREPGEVWVVNHLSDTVSVVSVPESRVIDTLFVPDEPADVAFAGGKAFVSAAASDLVYVFDAATRAPLAQLPISGKDPRALGVSPDGATVYALIQRSGNRTTQVPKQLAPPQPAPTNPALPDPPQTALIVSQDDPAWAGTFDYELDDHDVAVIDAATATVVHYVKGVGTILADVAVHPSTGELFVANTEARNAVRFEPVLRGHVIDSRVTRIAVGMPSVVQPVDLNPGIDYGLLPNPGALGTALAEPFGVAIDPGTDRVFVAAQGTDRVGVLDLAGVVQARIEIGETPGTLVSPRGKRGPRGLALTPDGARLFVFNRLSQTITIVDTGSLGVVREFDNGSVLSTPDWIREGRGFLYDAKLSGNGTASCAACHVDGEIDGLAWDLGDPGGELVPVPDHPDPIIDALMDDDFHPMKGPMTTQTLRGMDPETPLHWRGDKPTFHDFNGAFAALLGGDELAPDDMDLFADFAFSLAVPPNPHQPLDRSLATEPAEANQAKGLEVFETHLISSDTVPGKDTCVACHQPHGGSTGEVIPSQFLMIRVPPLVDVYRREGFNKDADGEHKSGFGLNHDGRTPGLDAFVQNPGFLVPPDLQDDLVAFLRGMDTGTAPATGHQIQLDGASVSDPSVLAELDVMMERAAAGDIDLIAEGWMPGGGVSTGLVFDPGPEHFVPDTNALPNMTRESVEAWVTQLSVTFLFTGVPVGEGARLAWDRDGDGLLDGDEEAQTFGTLSGPCTIETQITTGSPASAGSSVFALTATAAGDLPGAFVLGEASTVAPILGAELLVDPALVLPVMADALGTAAAAIPVPISGAGTTIYAQFLTLAACDPTQLSGSQGLAIAIGP